MGLLSTLFRFLWNGGFSNGIGEAFSNIVQSLDNPNAIKFQGNSLKDIQELKRMAEELPQFPVWSVGGSEFDLYDKSASEGTLSYRLTLKGTKEMLNSYKRILMAQGFRRSSNFPEISVLSKLIGKECYAFICPEDAVCDGEISVLFERNSAYWPDDYTVM